MVKLPDNEIMCSVRDGDLKKMGILFDKYHKRLFNFFLRQTRDQETSEDLVQEVFLRMLKYRIPIEVTVRLLPGCSLWPEVLFTLIIEKRNLK